MTRIRAATCTPVDFPSDALFWGRDTGLLCQSLRQAGVDCACIMPGGTTGIDQGGATRASFHELESTDWWMKQNLHFVVLYAWGNPRYLAIARAIRGAGIRLIQNLDCTGIESPYSDLSRWWISHRTMLSGPVGIKRRARLLWRMARDFFPSAYELSRVGMLAESDVISVVSPEARNSIQRYLEALGHGHLASLIRVIPHAVPDSMTYDGRSKRKLVIAVGRWRARDAHQKNPKLTLNVAAEFCRKHPDWTFRIIGSGASQLGQHMPQFRKPDNLEWVEHLDREALRECYLDAYAHFCASRFESYHIASAEAVCCGCRIIVPDHPMLSSTAWFTTDDSGSLARSHDPTDLLLALEKELSACHRRPGEIQSRSKRWSSQLAGLSVAKKVLEATEAGKSF